MIPSTFSSDMGFFHFFKIKGCPAFVNFDVSVLADRIKLVSKNGCSLESIPTLLLGTEQKDEKKNEKP